jgi:hypothetical protein
LHDEAAALYDNTSAEKFGKLMKNQGFFHMDKNLFLLLAI